MVGSSILTNGASLTVLGGGATCFSMGTYWETKPYQLQLPQDIIGNESLHFLGHREAMCKYLESPKVVPRARNESAAHATTAKASITNIPRVTLKSKGDFERLLREGNPVVICGMDLGECSVKWTPEYMVDCVGKEKEVSGLSRWLL